MAERRLVALAEQVEDVGALCEVVVRGGGARRLFVNEAADAQELAPRAGRAARIETVLAHLQALLGFFKTAGRKERFTCRKVRLNGVGRWHAWRVGELVGHGQRFVDTRRA